VHPAHTDYTYKLYGTERTRSDCKIATNSLISFSLCWRVGLLLKDKLLSLACLCRRHEQIYLISSRLLWSKPEAHFGNNIYEWSHHPAEFIADFPIDLKCCRFVVASYCCCDHVRPYWHFITTDIEHNRYSLPSRNTFRDQTCPLTSAPATL
jgi:hypothetical protein